MTNYIKQLQTRVKEQEQAIERAVKLITQFRKHLESSKFHTDTTIQISDVESRLIELRSELYCRTVETDMSCDARRVRYQQFIALKSLPYLSETQAMQLRELSAQRVLDNQYAFAEAQDAEENRKNVAAQEIMKELGLAQ